MAKYTKQKHGSEQTKEEAMKIAKGIQKPGQSKEQTKLVAQGIQKGIDLYKKQHKAKLREQSKHQKKLNKQKDALAPESEQEVIVPANRLPWILLATSWCLFALYFSLTQGQ